METQFIYSADLHIDSPFPLVTSKHLSLENLSTGVSGKELLW